jgi:hypothetical protein
MFFSKRWRLLFGRRRSGSASGCASGCTRGCASGCAWRAAAAAWSVPSDLTTASRRRRGVVTATSPQRRNTRASLPRAAAGLETSASVGSENWTGPIGPTFAARRRTEGARIQDKVWLGGRSRGVAVVAGAANTARAARKATEPPFCGARQDAKASRARCHSRR